MEYMYRILNRLEEMYHTKPVGGLYKLELGTGLSDYSKNRILGALPFKKARFKGNVLLIPASDMSMLWLVRRCPGCVHRRLLPTVTKSMTKYCLYCADTGNLRGCSVEDCFFNKIHFELRGE